MVDVSELDPVFAYLLGESDLNGLCFGDPRPEGSKRPPYWWRSYLRRATAALQAQLAAKDAEIARLSQDIELVKALAHIILSQAPADAERVNLFKSWDGQTYDLTCDQLRALSSKETP